MTRAGGTGFLANSVSNLLVGAAAMGYAVLVPAVVVRRFGTDVYGTWFLAFQVAAYVLLLDLGSQAVVTNEATDFTPESRAAKLTTAAMVSQLGLALTFVAVATCWAAITRQPELARLVAILGIAATTSLLASTVRAWFGGLQRSHVPAVWLIAARLGALAGLAVALATRANLITLTIAVAVPQLLIHGGLLLRARRAPSPWALPDLPAFIRLVRRTAPLAVWTVAGIFIAGIDIFVVRAVDAPEVGRYAIALPLLAVPTGIVTAAVAAWIPKVSGAQSPGNARDVTLQATAVATAALAVGAIVFVGFARELVDLWAGPGRWGPAASFLQILYVASTLRFVFIPWTVLILVRDEQRLITFVPVAEAAINLAASVVLGLWLGALGVAIGTLAGAVGAAVLFLGWAIPRTSDSGVSTAGLLRAGAEAWPALVAAGALGACVLLDAPAEVRGASALLTGAAGAWLLIGRRRAIPAKTA